MQLRHIKIDDLRDVSNCSPTSQHSPSSRSYPTAYPVPSSCQQCNALHGEVDIYCKRCQEQIDSIQAQMKAQDDARSDKEIAKEAYEIVSLSK